jgi:hypothetical protein
MFFEITDAGGKPVRQIEAALLPIDEGRVQIDFSGLPAGTYRLHAVTLSEKVSLQFVHLR